MKNKKLTKYYLYIVAFFYVICWLLAFVYGDGNYLHQYHDYYSYDECWMLDDGTRVSFPYVPDGPFSMSAHLDDVYYDDRLILWNLRYESIAVFVDDEMVFQTKGNNILGIETDAGKNMLLVPMKEEYSNKDIRLEIIPRDSLYSIQLTSVFIKTETEFMMEIIKKNLWTFILSIVLVSSGVLYLFISLLYKLLSPNKAQNRYEIIMLAGLFSISCGLWTIFDSRIIGLIIRNNTFNAMATYLVFDVMGIPLVAMIKDITEDKVKSLRLLYHFSIFLPAVQILLFLTGIMDLTESLCFTQAFFGMGFLMLAVTAILGMPQVRTRKERIITRTGSIFFAVFGSIGLLIYVFDRNGPYKSFVLAAVFLYILTEVFLVIAKMQLADEEQIELVQNREYAYSDSLTNLSNARAYAEKLNELRKNGISENMSLIFIDINRLKYYNDTRGHETGDKLIVATADCIRKAFDSSLLISRRGGDEFVILTDVAPVELDRYVLRLSKAIAEWNSKHDIELSVSVGGASAWDNPGCGIDKLCEIADLNMYKDKEKFYNRTGYDRRK